MSCDWLLLWVLGYRAVSITTISRLPMTLSLSLSLSLSPQPKHAKGQGAPMRSLGSSSGADPTHFEPEPRQPSTKHRSNPDPDSTHQVSETTHFEPEPDSTHQVSEPTQFEPDSDSETN